MVAMTGTPPDSSNLNHLTVTVRGSSNSNNSGYDGVMSEPRWLDDREMAAWTAFLEASNLIARRVEQGLRDQAGLSHPQYEILVRLADAPGREMRMTELADRVVTSKSGLTYQITRMEKAGLVRRRTCSSDDRGVYAVLTDDG